MNLKTENYSATTGYAKTYNLFAILTIVLAVLLFVASAMLFIVSFVFKIQIPLAVFITTLSMAVISLTLLVCFYNY